MFAVEHLQLVNSPEPQRPESLATLKVVPTELGDLQKAVVDREGGSDHVLFGLPWSEFVSRPDALMRYAIMAEAMDAAQFTAIDTPGIGPHARPLPHETSRLIRAGDFSLVAEAQWQAVDPKQSEYTVIGYSQSVALSAAMAATAPESTFVKKIVLWEGLTKSHSPVTIMARFALEAAKWGSYFDENADWMTRPGSGPILPKEKLLHSSAYLTYPIGLAKAPVFDDMKTAREREIINETTEVYVISGNQSHVAPEKEAAEFAMRLYRELGLSGVRLVLLNESHGLIDSSNKVAQILSLLQRR